MIRPTVLAFIALASGAIAAAPTLGSSPSHETQAQGQSPSPAAQRGLAFAQAHCSGCHAVTADSASPNPEAPPFDAVANMPGLSEDTLRQFLRDSHNYPAAMDFTVDVEQIDDLTAWMLTLRTADYHPPI